MAHRRVLEWLARPSAARGIHFATREGWEFSSYAELAGLAHRVGESLADAGIRVNDVVALMGGSTRGFVATFFGAMLAGATPAPLPPPPSWQFSDDYRNRLVATLRVAAPQLIVTDVVGSATLRETVATGSSARVVAADELMLRAPSTRRAPPLCDIALVQFTSGVSGHCRAVRVPFTALDANIAAIQRWLAWSEADCAVSWLPVCHDMGLIGCLISAVVAQCDFRLLNPEHFARSPLRYLRCLSENRAQLTAMPNFALDHIVRRVRAAELSGTDFSACRGIIVGGDLLRPPSFDAFYGLLAPFGLPREALLPAYGLAEATVAVTGRRIGEPWKSVEVDSHSTSIDRAIAAYGSSGGTRIELIGCGRPLSGVSLAIQGTSGQELPHGHLGEIVVRGDSVAEGYLPPSAESDDAFTATGLRTGDIGFMEDGELFVLGRAGDSVKLRGRSLFAEDVESALATLGIPMHRAAALLGWHDGEPTVLVLLERPDAGWIERVRSLLRARIEEGHMVVQPVPPGTIRRTSSGKLRRRELWRMFCEGALPVARAQDE